MEIIAFGFKENITWANYGLYWWHIYASPGHNQILRPHKRMIMEQGSTRHLPSQKMHDEKRNMLYPVERASSIALCFASR